MQGLTRKITGIALACVVAVLCGVSLMVGRINIIVHSAIAVKDLCIHHFHYCFLFSVVGITQLNGVRVQMHILVCHVNRRLSF